ncbi:transglycosylase SLT domain-containing protein [Paraburkholderia sediminicola]|uniref:transglycosylase SLT domain-containing protein n=1 Tax=Paraburkholderia sediminicola TaxID=458836 RepID=UPI0038B83B0C
MDKPVISIPIDDADFMAFLEKFDQFKEDAKTGVDPFAGAAHSAQAADVAAAGMTTAFQAFSKAAVSSKMTGNQSFSFLFARDMHFAAKDTKEIDKNLAKSSKSMLGFNRQWSALKTAAKAGLGLFGIPGAIGAAAAKTASDLAKDNQRNRELNVEPGIISAFNNGFKRFGLSDADVERMRDAQSDVTKWKTFSAAGLSPQQIQGMDPTELTAFMDRWAGSKAREWKANGQPLAQMSKAYGLDDLLSNNQIRLAGSYSDEEHDKAFSQFKADVPKFSIDQKTEDEATDQLKQWNDTWTRIRRNLETSFMTLTPQLTALGTAVADAVADFVKSPEIKDDLDQLDEGLRGILPFFKSVTQFNKDNQFSIPDAGAKATGDALMKYPWYRSLHDTLMKIPGVSDSDAPDAPDTSTTGAAAYRNLTQAAEKKYGLPSGLQALQMQVESRGVPTAVNKDTGAQGLMQFMPSTSKSMGIDPFDPKQATDAGGRLLRKFADIYGSLGKGLGAYDGDTHISADAKKYKSWLMGAKQETLNYLRPFQDAGYDLGLSDSEKDYLTKHSKAFKGVANDANLKPSAPALDESQFKVVDMSQEGKPKQGTDNNLGETSGLSRFLANYFGEGAGAKYASSQRVQAADSKPINVGINVKVSTPAGASTNVTMGGIPQ